MKKKTLWIIASVIIILGVLSGTAYYFYENVVNIDTIYEGIYIEEYDVSKMKKEEALNYIVEEKKQELKDRSLNLSHGDIEYSLSLNDIGFSYNYIQAAEKAYEVARTGNPFTRYGEIKKIKDEKYIIPLKPAYSESKIVEEVEKIAEEINQEAVDAKINFANGTFTVSPEQTGISVKKDELTNLIEENIVELKDINIPTEIINPKYTEDYYSRVNGLLGEYSTSFKGSSSGRIENIKLSAKAFNNLLIHPGQEVSYNEITGPKRKEYGYKEAPVIVGGELVPGLGGGVCQTSTTLYNTLLLADLTITERSPHSIPPNYVNLGRDAAVASGYLDLKFRNDFDYPIYMTSKVVGTRVYFYVYGDAASRDYKVKISEEVVDFRPFTTKEVLDETMEPGAREVVQQGRNGYKSKTYKSIVKNGKVISSKQINSDYYRERQHIVKHGPKVPEKPAIDIESQEPEQSQETMAPQQQEQTEETQQEESQEVEDENTSLDSIEQNPES